MAINFYFINTRTVELKGKRIKGNFYNNLHGNVRIFRDKNWAAIRKEFKMSEWTALKK